MEAASAGPNSVVTILPASARRSAVSFLPSLAVALALGCVSNPPPVVPKAQVAPMAVAIASPAPAAKPMVPALESGVAVERDLPAGGRDELPLQLAAGHYIRLLFDANDLDLDARLIGPAGETIARLESSDGHLSAITTSTGLYRFAVTPLDPKTGGHYRITLEKLRSSGAGDGDRVDVDASLAEAVHLRSLGTYDEGIKKAEKALGLCRNLQDRDCEFEALYEIGSSAISQGDRSKALLTYAQAQKVAEVDGNRRNQGRALAALGAVLTQSQKPVDVETARPALEQALQIWQEAGDSYRQSGVLYNLAVGRYSLGKFDDAIESYQNALSLTDPAGALASNLWNGLGNVYTSRGESLKALKCFDTALEIAEKTQAKGAEAAALTSAGNIYQRRGEPQKALRNFQRALEINQKDPRLKTDEGKVLLQMGTVNVGLGQIDDASAEYQKALGYFQMNRDEKWIATALWTIGRVDLVRERPEEALEHLGEALEIATRVKILRAQGSVLHEIGVARLKLRQFSQAERSLEAALPLLQQTDRLGEALTRQALAKAYLEQGDLARAHSFLREALKIADDVGASLNRSAIHYDLARLQRRQNDLPEALSEIEQAIKILEAVRSNISEDRLRTSFFASRRPYYDFWVDLLMELDGRNPGQGYKDQALAASDKGRARGLLDLLTQERVELKRGIDPELRKREAEARARLTQIQNDLIEERSSRRRPPFIEALEGRLEEADREQRDIEAEIKLRFPLYYQLQYPSLLDRGEIQRLLPSQDSALLEYSLGEQHSYLFVVTAEGLAVHPLALSQQEISEQIERLGTGFRPGGPLPFAYRLAALKLYQALIAPAQKELAGKRHLLIAPDGILSYLPFDALLTRQGQDGTVGLPYLLYDFSISYIPSASVLSSLSLQRPSVAASGETALRFLGIAPEYGPAPAQDPARSAGSTSGPLPELAAARREVEEIARRYRPNEKKIFLGLDASKENVERNPLIADRVHFAGHGLVDEEHPENSALVLSDGPLRVSDIFNLELKADLVVLSACKTAGKQVTGEGLVGLARAFLYAGSPSVVVTLWQVVDSPTSDLMNGFYENLDREGDKADALRQAKIGLIRRKGRLALPYYWAPFVLVGKSQ
jgi:CHAT domain-containing protein/tetratricopeptide (TPR) repeat protein